MAIDDSASTSSAKRARPDDDGKLSAQEEFALHFLLEIGIDFLAFATPSSDLHFNVSNSVRHCYEDVWKGHIKAWVSTLCRTSKSVERIPHPVLFFRANLLIRL